MKSLGVISLTETDVTERGLELDRRWMLVDSRGKFLSQREFPEMSLIDVGVVQNGLIINRRGRIGDSIIVPWQPDHPATASVNIWKDLCEAVVYSDECNDWFSNTLGITCRLVRYSEKTKRAIDPEYATGDQEVSFADGFPCLIIGEESLSNLNSRLDKPIGMDRFRTNLVFSGGVPYIEDTWKRIRIGDVNFKVVKPCARCVMTTIDPLTAETGIEPLRTLGTYRKLENRGVMFGQNLIPLNRGRISAGMAVEVVG